MPCALLPVPAIPAGCYAGPPAAAPLARRVTITSPGRHAQTLGTSTVTVTGTSAPGASASTTVVWTISPRPGS